jgi:hypothetical protein
MLTARSLVSVRHRPCIRALGAMHLGRRAFQFLRVWSTSVRAHTSAAPLRQAAVVAKRSPTRLEMYDVARGASSIRNGLHGRHDGERHQRHCAGRDDRDRNLGGEETGGAQEARAGRRVSA